MAISDFLLNTDYPLDSIVFITSGSRSITGPTILDTLTIPHGLPFAPLACIVWSLTADFAITYTLSDATTTITSGASADATNIYIISNNLSASTITLYYKVFAFPPSGASEDSLVASTASVTNDFVLNTDNNYLKLVHAGTISTVNTSYAHNLGYIPTVFVWLNSTHDQNVLGQWVVIDPLGNAGIKLTTTTIEFVGASVNDTAVEYRIYADN